MRNPGNAMSCFNSSRKRRRLHPHARLRRRLASGDGFFGDINDVRPTRVVEMGQAIHLF